MKINAKHYEINEKDIETLLRILRTKHPEAQPEHAIKLLKSFKSTFHNLEQSNPVMLEEMYQQLMEDKENSRN